MTVIAEQIAKELNVNTAQVNSAIRLLDEGATVPFIARYRKEATQGLDDGHLRQLAQRLSYLRELNDRRDVILANIKQQGKLSPSLQQDLANADNKTRLEDLYLPFKPKRKTKGQLAIAAGLSPLADTIYNNWQLDPEQQARAFITDGFADEKSVLDGVLSILIERFCEDANLLQKLRQHVLKQAHLCSKVVKDKQQAAAKYRDYHQHNELLKKVPSHRFLAMLRGKNEGFLTLSIDVDIDGDKNYCSAINLICDHYGLRFNHQAAAAFLQKVVKSAWQLKLKPSIETAILSRLKEQAETEAISVFSKNLADLLMAAPAGAKVTLGLDPGMRTGCKVAIVDGTGKLLHHCTIFPHAPQNHWDKALRTLVNLCLQYKVALIAIGNGTGSRESDKLVAEVIAQLTDQQVSKVMVSEAGASVYSASELAANEFPDLDVSIRGAVSIARRLQDPLAELVKIDPKAIGVGQYQHDVSQSQLSQSLDNVIEDCVNAIGVDVNSASAALLTHVAGLNKTIANNIVTYRDQHGRFTNRQQLKKVPRLGAKAFEQAAGFLRINHGDNPLDASAVHPETYHIIEKIIAQTDTDISQLIGNKDILQKLDTSNLTNQQFGDITIKDILQELEKPGRDPRPEFKTAQFKDGVNTLADLKVGMILEGVVSNVANFGAFVDVGVHQDGLVHISALTNKFVSNPHDVVKAGDIVKVKVIEVDVERKRVNLSMRLDDNPTASSDKPKPATKPNHVNKAKKAVNKTTKPAPKAKKVQNAAMGNAFADALAKLKK